MPTNAAATGFWTAQTSNNARQGRALLQGLYQNIDTTPTNGARSGVVPSTWDTGNLRFSDLLVTVTSGLTMSVAPGVAVAHRNGQGPYEGWLLSAASVTCDPAPASNPRNDIVIMRWYDAAQGDTSPDGNPCRIEIITGTPGAVPVDPITVNSLGVYTSFPTSGGGIGIPLARAQVSTGGVITLTRLRRSVGVIGATRALMEGDSDNNGSVGGTRYNPGTDKLEIRNSAGTWNPIPVGTPPLGVIARQKYTTNNAAGTTAELVQDFIPFTLATNRYYRVTLSGQLFYQNAAYATIRFRVANGASAPSTSSPIVFENDLRSTIANNFETRTISAAFKGSELAAAGLSAGTATIGVGTFITTGNGGGQFIWQGASTKTRMLWLEDCGPE